MKKTPALVACAIALTVVFYMASTYLLPGPAPGGALVGLFAAVALAIVLGGSALWKRLRGPKTVGAKAVQDAGRKRRALPKTQGLIIFVVSGLMAALLQGCKSRESPSSAGPISTSPGPEPAPTNQGSLYPNPRRPAPPKPAPGMPNSTSPPPDFPGSMPSSTAPPAGSSAMPRVTGIGYLLSEETEEQGYGLYSYALLSHPPSASERPQYQAFIKALVALPTAQALARYVPRRRINLTSIPMVEADVPDEDDGRVAYILQHYDYARSAVLEACLTTRTGPGPVLVSVLQPIDPAAHPTPVLVQDLTRAQPTLMATYVNSFVSQVAQERFWEQSTLGQFALALRNSLETAAVGLGMSQTAVSGWIKFFGKSAPAAKPDY